MAVAHAHHVPAAGDRQKRTAQVSRRLHLAGGSAVGLLALLLLVVGPVDQSVSLAVRDPDAGWALFLERYGQLPGVLVGLLGATILLRLLIPPRDVRAWLGLLVVSALLLLSSLQVALELGAHVAGHTDVRRALGVGIPVAVVSVLVSRRVPRAWAASARPAAVVALTLPYLASVVTVWALKIPWGRWTPRDITAAGDPSLFSPWYLPQGDNGHYSFISGHTSFAFVVLALVLVFATTTRALTVGLLLCLSWGVIGAAGRVVLGAHFPSDTLAAAALTLLWAVVLVGLARYQPPEPGRAEEGGAS